LLLKWEFGMLLEQMRLLEIIEYCNGKYDQIPATPR
jgi:hypothetical protein